MGVTIIFIVLLDTGKIRDFHDCSTNEETHKADIEENI